MSLQYSLSLSYVMFCAIWFHLSNLKNLENLHGGVLLLQTGTLLKVTVRSGCFSFFFFLIEIVQCNTTMQKKHLIRIYLPSRL